MPPDPAAGNRYFVWAGGDVNRRLGDQHYLAVGASGSGKSTLINHVIDSVIRDPGVRALVYDPKQELVPFLYGIRGFKGDGKRVSSSVVLLHPFDTRGAAWDMAKDIDSPIGARQLATILVPDGETTSASGSFFTSAVRDVLTGVLLAFIECAPRQGAWTFRDVLLTVLYEPYLDFVLGIEKTRRGHAFGILHRLRENYFGKNTDPVTKANIRASLNTRLSLYEPVAAAWQYAERASDFGGSFSLKAWMDETPGEDAPGTILVLGNDEAGRAALDPINQALFKRATEMVLARKERTPQEKQSGANQIWFFLDEVREAGKLDGLGRLMTKGRSKNACVAMGFQDIDGMRDVYGTELANEMCAQFSNVAVLRVNSPATATWASELFGSRLEESKNSSTTYQVGEQPSFNMASGRTEAVRPFFDTEAFLYGTNAAEAKAVVGLVRGPDVSVAGMGADEVREACRFREPTEVARASQRDLVRGVLEARGISTPDLIQSVGTTFMIGEYSPRPPSQQYLHPWTRLDFERLGFEGDPPPIFNAENRQREESEGASGGGAVSAPSVQVPEPASPTTQESLLDKIRRFADDMDQIRTSDG